MKKKLLIVLSAFAFIFVFFGMFFGVGVHAEEEAPATSEEPKNEEVVAEEPKQEETEIVVVEEETTTLTTEEKNKINQLVDFIQSLSKDELLQILNQAKGWFIALGLTGVIALVSAFIGLIAAITKLRNEKIRNSQLTEQAKQEQIEASNNAEKMIVDKTNEIKELMLQFMNGLTDTEKKIVESNIAEVKAKMLQFTNKEE